MGKKKEKLVFGWGVNDVDYSVTMREVINCKSKKVWLCPYYVKWVSIIRRCKYSKLQEKYPTYKGCTVTEEWKYLSNFIQWVDSQPNRDWQSCEPDKDILTQGNKHYSPETVVFIPNTLNLFIAGSGIARGDYMIGVNYRPYHNNTNPYVANCCNPFTKKKEHLGYYSTELEAHRTWQAKKHEYALQLAEIQEDERVVSRLREMYAPDKDWTKVKLKEIINE